MPATTPIAGYPFPLDPDPIDVAGDIRHLAAAIDAEPGIRRIFTNKAALDAGWAPIDGAHAYTTTEQQEWVRNIGTWVRAGTEAGVVPATGTVKVVYAAEASNVPSTARSLVISSVTDSLDLVTQFSNDVRIDKAGIWTVNMGVTSQNDTVWNNGTGFELQVPAGTKFRRWFLTSSATPHNANLSYTGKFANGVRLRWRVDGRRVTAATLDLIPIIFTT